jgi:ABC-2 type transport system ATP-binding protein
MDLVAVDLDAVVEVRGLRKSYGAVEAVRGVDLAVARGQVFALLGPNGAGKTSIVEILEGYRERTGGDVSVLGFDPATGGAAYKARIGIVLQSTGMERYLTVRELMEATAGYYPHPRPVAEALAMTDLEDRATVPVRRLSGGQRRRLDLALALVGDPDVVFLDEPTTGFDPSARHQAWEVIRGLAGLGKTILLTTHFMDEAQVLADRLAVIVDGTIVAEGSPDEVIGEHATTTLVRVRPRDPAAFPAPELGFTADPGDPGWWRAEVAEPTRLLHRVTGWSLDGGGPLDDISVTRPSLEDVYLMLTGHRQDEPGAVADEPPGRRRRRR